MNVSEHVQFFIQEMTRRHFSKQTIKNYGSCAEIFFRQSTKDHPKNINEADIREFLGKFTTANTQRAYHSAIKKFYEICLGQHDKFRYIPYCKADRKLPVILSQDELQKLFSAITNIKHKAIVALMYSTGMRVSEIINLKIADIDSRRMVIYVKQAKGNKDRMVMLDGKVLDLLRIYFKQYKPKEYLFNGQFELYYSSRSINEFLQHYGKKAGITKYIHAHLLRHNCFSDMVSNGTDINLIQRLAGHKNAKTTAIYLHISDKTISRIQSPINQINL
jgi:integrase/recombinase XerD